MYDIPLPAGYLCWQDRTCIRLSRRFAALCVPHYSAVIGGCQPLANSNEAVQLLVHRCTSPRPIQSHVERWAADCNLIVGFAAVVENLSESEADLLPTIASPAFAVLQETLLQMETSKVVDVKAKAASASMQTLLCTIPCTHHLSIKSCW